MEGSTFKARLARLGFVVAVLGALFVAGQYTTYVVAGASYSGPPRCDLTTSSQTFASYGKAYESGLYNQRGVTLQEEGLDDGRLKLTMTTEAESCNMLWGFSADKSDRAFGYFFGAIGLAIAALLLLGALNLLGWLWRGPNQYVDPCQNDECPCRRHVVEREQAENARRLAMAAAAGAVAGTIVGS